MDKRRLEELFSTGWPDLDAFYMDDADGARANSGEVDFGVQWRGAATFPSYQLSWVIDTGELYLQELPTGRVAVVAVFESRGRLELSLEGWAEACGPIGSLQWLFDWVDFGTGLEGRTGNGLVGRARRRIPQMDKTSVEFRDPSQLLYD